MLQITAFAGLGTLQMLLLSWNVSNAANPSNYGICWSLHASHAVNDSICCSWEHAKCCKLQHLLVLECLKSVTYSICWSRNISNAANYNISKGPGNHRTRGPWDQRTQGPKPYQERATPLQTKKTTRILVISLKEDHDLDLKMLQSVFLVFWETPTGLNRTAGGSHALPPHHHTNK